MSPDVGERRYLGAVRFVEATTRAQVQPPIVVRATNASFFANRSGLFVVQSAGGLAAHNDSFEAAPTLPKAGSVRVSGTVRDPAWRFLPRRFRLDLPRDASPDKPRDADSLFRPVDVPLLAAPGAPTEPNWALFRATLVRADDRSRLGGALVRVRRQSDGAELALGMSDLGRDPADLSRTRRTVGEVLVPVAGLPITVWSSGPGPVVVNEIPVVVEIAYADPGADGFPDPDALAALPVSAANRFPFNLASGKALLAGELGVTLP